MPGRWPKSGPDVPSAPPSAATFAPRTVLPHAALPAELRGAGRDDVRLLVSSGRGHRGLHFTDLPRALAPGDLLVVNDSATLAASLPAEARLGTFRLNLSTRYGPRLWLAEPRRSHDAPGPLALDPGDLATIGSRRPVRARFVVPYPGSPRLWFVAVDAPLEPTLAADGVPIRYAYLDRPQPLAAYQTVFARVPGSAEMPSAARPFSRATLAALEARGVGVATLTLHTGVSSIEIEPEQVDPAGLYAEPFEVDAATAERIEAAREIGGRVIAVGTTVVRALETAFRQGRVRAASGFTRRYVRPGAVRGAVDGLLTGFHEPRSTHLALLTALAGEALVAEAYRVALGAGYLWHEFGDVHLLLPDRGAEAAQ